MRHLTLTCLILAGCAQDRSDTANPQPTGELRAPSQPTASRLDEPPLSVLPLALKDFSTMVPLGNLNPTGHVIPTDHHYFVLKNPQLTVPVYAPGNGDVILVRRAYQHKAKVTDYSLTIAISPDLSVEFMHLGSLSTALLQAVGTFPASGCQTYSTGGETYTNCSKSLRFPLRAGVKIGNAGGLPNNRALDFGVFDRRVTHTFANPTRFAQNQYSHAVDCLSYYSVAERSLLAGRSGNWRGSIRIRPPLGGTIAWDIPGTAQGNWFRKQQPTWPEDPHLAFVRDNFDPTVCAISMGTSLSNSSPSGLAPGAYLFRPLTTGTSNRDFADILPGTAVYSFTRFRGAAGVLLVRLVDAKTLHVEWQAGTAGPPWTMVQPTVFER